MRGTLKKTVDLMLRDMEGLFHDFENICPTHNIIHPMPDRVKAFLKKWEEDHSQLYELLSHIATAHQQELRRAGYGNHQEFDDHMKRLQTIRVKIRNLKIGDEEDADDEVWH